jgi:hypothetical protein
MDSITTHNASDFIPADKNCNNCRADIKPEFTFQIQNDNYICQTPLNIDDFCQCCWRVLCECKEGNSETRPLPAYRKVTKKLLLPQLKESAEKSMKTETEEDKNAKKDT